MKFQMCKFPYLVLPLLNPRFSALGTLPDSMRDHLHSSDYSFVKVYFHYQFFPFVSAKGAHGVFPDSMLFFWDSARPEIKHTAPTFIYNTGDCHSW